MNKYCVQLLQIGFTLILTSIPFLVVFKSNPKSGAIGFAMLFCFPGIISMILGGIIGTYTSIQEKIQEKKEIAKEENKKKMEEWESKMKKMKVFIESL